jgi:hypothetical protein
MRKRKDQRNTGNVLRTHICWHVMETIIFVIPMLNIVISTSLRIWLKTNGNDHFYDLNAEHCYLNLPEDMVENNPLDLENIKEKKDEDNDLQQSLAKHPTWYSHKNINDIDNILCYTKPDDNAAKWKIVLPKDLIVPTIRWYHQVTGHRGSKRLYQHIH